VLPKLGAVVHVYSKDGVAKLEADATAHLCQKSNSTRAYLIRVSHPSFPPPSASNLELIQLISFVGLDPSVEETRYRLGTNPKTRERDACDLDGSSARQLRQSTTIRRRSRRIGRRYEFRRISSTEEVDETSCRFRVSLSFSHRRPNSTDCCFCL
jgi:hypothetical protein